MNLASGILGAYTGFQKGRRLAHERDYEEDQDALKRSDRLKELADAAAAMRESRDRENQWHQETVTRQQAQDDIDEQAWRKKAAEEGYDPITQIHEQGVQDADAGRLRGGLGGFALTGVGTAKQGIKGTFRIGTDAMAKARESQAQAKTRTDHEYQIGRDKVNDDANAATVHEQMEARKAMAREGNANRAAMMSAANASRESIAQDRQAAQKARLDRIPPKVKIAMQNRENSRALIARAINEVKTNPDAFGLTNWGPIGALKDQFMPNKKDIGSRSVVGDQSSMMILDRSGAAVSLGEFARSLSFNSQVWQNPVKVLELLEKLQNKLEEEHSMGLKFWGMDQDQGGQSPPDTRSNIKDLRDPIP